MNQKLKAGAPGLSPWQLPDQFQRIVQVEVRFKLKAGETIQIKARKVVKFRVAKAAKDAILGVKKQFHIPKAKAR